VSEERLARIETKLDALSGAVESIAGTVATLAAGQAELVSRVTRLEDGDMRLEVRVGTLVTGQDELRRHMRILHEEALDTMKALDPAPWFGEFRREIAAGQETITLRLAVVEQAVHELWKRQPSP
jgi:hypothetical protein